MIFHNDLTCTSLLQYTHTHTSTSINTNNLCLWMGYFWRGGDFKTETSFLMITDKFLTEMPFRDVTEITTSDNEQNYGVNMSTNNNFLVEIDPDHNTLSSVKGVVIMIHR